MTVPNSPTEGGGAKILFLLWDNGGVNASALFRGVGKQTMNGEAVAHVAVATHTEGEAFEATDQLVAIGGVENGLVKKIIVDSSGRVISRPALAYDAGAIPGFAHQRALGQATLEGEMAAAAQIGTHLQATAVLASDTVALAAGKRSDNGQAIALRVDSAGRLQTSGSDSALGGTGRKDVAVTGTAVALRGATPCSKVRVKADPANVAPLTIGISTVANVVTGDSATAGYLLAAGNEVEIGVADVATVFINGTANDGASYMFWA